MTIPANHFSQLTILPTNPLRLHRGPTSPTDETRLHYLVRVFIRPLMPSLEVLDLEHFKPTLSRSALSATIGATAFRGHIDCPGFGRRLNPRWSAPRADRRTGSRRSTSDRGASPAPIRFPPDNFKHSLTLFSKSFSSSLAVLVRYRSLAVFSLGRNLPPDWGCIPKQPDSPTAPRGAAGSGHDGALTLSGAPFQGTWARSAAEDASPDYNSDGEAARFSSWAIPGSLAVTRGILVSFFSSAY
ncbi:hypothetical protein Sango_0364800 [Sesamum angolense]|uniref:Uncharacterized protein n=1 Tax=Sesamum angolense TaxID=2727404 RepID=A0AAE2C3P4_9LAMI|nr:hypothetical protein Sango_0364800 [Sesamum angolense]